MIGKPVSIGMTQLILRLSRLLSNDLLSHLENAHRARLSYCSILLYNPPRLLGMCVMVELSNGFWCCRLHEVVTALLVQQLSRDIDKNC